MYTLYAKIHTIKGKTEKETSNILGGHFHSRECSGRELVLGG